MDYFINILYSLLLIAGLVEALAELIKTPYLKIKNTIAIINNKPAVTECTKYEKRLITVILSLAFCIIGKFGVDIPAWDEPVLLQYIIAGILASLGSNLLHTFLSIFIAFKDALEKFKQATSGTDNTNTGA